MKLDKNIGLDFGPGHTVSDGDPVPPNKGQCPNFRHIVCCGKTAGYIKMPLGTEVGLGSCHIVRWGPSSPLKKGHSPPFSAHVYCDQTVAHLRYC